MSTGKLEDLSVDEFMNSGFDSDVTDGEDGDDRSNQAEPVHKKGKQKKDKKTKLKDSLSSLKTKDPEFYEFLKEEDQKLLEFSDDDDSEGEGEESVSEEEGAGEDVDEEDELMKKLEAMESSDDDDEEEDDGDDDDRKEPGKKGVHKLPAKLEVSSHLDSSEEDTEDEEGEDYEEEEISEPKSKKMKEKGTLVTTKMVREWIKTLKASASIKTLRNLKKAFKAAVHQAGSEEVEKTRYRVEGSKVFNAIVRACLQYVIPTLNKILRLPHYSEDSDKPVLPSTSVKWRKVAADVKGYVTSVIELLSHMSDPSMVDIVIKHVLRLVPYFAVFPRLARIMLKRMIMLWGSAEESTRVLAFLCIVKLMQRLKDSMLEFCLKRMYLTYVKNCKFTSPSTLPLINFMQRSLVEVFALNINLTYQYGFVYIRQLAIHLRNAITLKKKENCQAVYNWQFVHCLHLWARVVSTIYPNEVIEHLIYPLTETIVGTIKLLPTARYFPLRFHCVRTLNLISSSTNTFIPVLPFLIEVFEQTNFNKKHKSISFKPFNFACILKLSKSQLEEKSFRDGVIDQLYELLLEHFHIHSHSVGFPELALPALLQLKDFLKKCKIANYCKQIKQIVEKVEETSKLITQRRKSASFRLSDKTAVEAWERRSKEEGTPLSKFYTTWRKLRDRELQHEIAGKERLSTEVDQFPEIIRRKAPAKASAEDRKEFAELFESDSEDSGDEARFLLKEERPKAAKKKQKSSDGASDDSEDYSDFDSDELEQLAGSADDSDNDEDDGDDDDEGDSPADKGGDGNDNGDGDEDSDVPDKEDVVKDFTFSSDEDD